MKWIRRWLRCPEFIWPELQEFEDCQCAQRRWHSGPHYDMNGDIWEGKRR